MLVCSVSLLRRRAAIAADLAEAAAAQDAPGTGNVVFATLVDDPASVRESVDAFLGQIMREAASAASTVNAGFAYAAAITEAAAAADLLSSFVPLAVVETATAVSTQDATVVSGVAYVTWDSATVTAVTLSGGNLVATNTGTTATEQGAKVASASGKTSGKYYIEFTLTTKVGAGGGNVGAGIGTFASTYTGMGNNGATGAMVFFGPGNIYSNGSSAGVSIPTILQGDTAGAAIDVDNRRIWFRKGAAGLWNNSGTANPATNTGGIVIPAGTMVPFAVFGGGSGTAGNVTTANFGASAFVGLVPSGFTAGWTV